MLLYRPVEHHNNKYSVIVLSNATTGQLEFGEESAKIVQLANYEQDGPIPEIPNNFIASVLI